MVYDPVPASTDERVAAETVLAHVTNVDVLGNKGFLGDACQAYMPQPPTAFGRRNGRTKNSKIRLRLTVSSIRYANRLRVCFMRCKIPDAILNAYW